LARRRTTTSRSLNLGAVEKGRREYPPAAQPGSKFIGNCNFLSPGTSKSYPSVTAFVESKLLFRSRNRKAVVRGTRNFLGAPPLDGCPPCHGRKGCRCRVTELKGNVRGNTTARPSVAGTSIVGKANCLRRPVDRRMLQASPDHLASQLIGVLANGLVRRKSMLVRSIGLDLLSNVLVEMSEPLVRHTFDAHD
jgi:hypothetical protein